MHEIFTNKAFTELNNKCETTNPKWESGFSYLRGEMTLGSKTRNSFRKLSYSATPCPTPKTAFTLAEVLITLGIIGVVATLVIVRFINSYSEMQNISKLKKAYSTIQNALNLAISENGTVDTWSTYTSNGSGGTTEDVANIFSKYLNVAETLNSNIQGYYVDLDNKHRVARYADRPLSMGKKYILRDGTLFAIVTFARSNDKKYWCNNPPTGIYTFCGFINVDLNGYKKGPNKYGYDTFGFILYTDKIVPMGKPDESSFYWGSFDSCKSGASVFGCTAWALMNENMDYLHCPQELSFNGKKSCK